MAEGHLGRVAGLSEARLAFRLSSDLLVVKFRCIHGRRTSYNGLASGGGGELGWRLLPDGACRLPPGCGHSTASAPHRPWLGEARRRTYRLAQTSRVVEHWNCAKGASLYRKKVEDVHRPNSCILNCIFPEFHSGHCQPLRAGRSRGMAAEARGRLGFLPGRLCAS